MATKKKRNKGRRPPSRPASKSHKPQSKPQAKQQGGTQTPTGAPPSAGSTPPPAAKSAKTTETTKAGTTKAETTKAETPKVRAEPPKAKAPRPGSRAERLEAARRARRRKAVLTRVTVVGVVVILAAVVAYIVVSNRQEKSQAIEKLEKGSCQYDEEYDRDGGAGRNHVNGNLQYDTNPPSGGDHNPQAAPPSQYTAQNAPPDAQVVHSMEHGYVIIWYKPDLSEDAVNQLKAVTDKYSRDVLLVPRANMDTPVAATVWHKRLLCQNAEPDTLDTFITSYRNQGPEKVPH